MHSVTLEHAADFAGFRAAARRLLRAGVPPEAVSWGTAADTAALLVAEAPEAPTSGETHTPEAPTSGEAAAPTPGELTVPRAFVALAERVVLHRDPGRFALLYRLLWRLRAERRLLQDAIDPDVARARALEKAVDRDIHKMHAYVRFREVPGAEPQVLIAWFEPDHHIIEAAAPFFVRRFPHSAWTILAPGRSAHWDTRELRFGPGGRRADAPADDAAEALWRNYYTSIFNPARLNVNAMRAHMPKKYWRNLPEAELIPGLVAAAEKRSREMLNQPPTEPAKRRRPVPPPGALPPPVEDGSLDALRGRAERCRSCALWQHATQTVFGEGPAAARIVLVGEQPGDQEDIAGKPFVGPAGRLLDRALRDAGIDRRAVYVTNAVKHFKFEPRGKRRIHKTPGQLEIAACRQWLERELRAVRPRFIVALGATAALAVLGRAVPVQKSRGKLIPMQDQTTGRHTEVLVTVHPSYLLRLPDEQKAAAYRELVADLARAVPSGSPPPEFA